MEGKPVAVLCGGQSPERDISLRSGQAVLRALQEADIAALAVDPDERLLHTLQDGEYQRAFIALHGKGGEDGSVQGLLDALGLPYTGSGMAASALAGDKIRCKYAWLGAGLPTPAFMPLGEDSDWEEVQRTLGPVFVKPSHGGSSLGTAYAESVGEIAAAWAAARVYDPQVLAESAVSGAEYTVGILHGRALPAVRIDSARNFYDYAAKYEDAGTRLVCPAGLSQEEETGLRALALQAFSVLGCSGWGRVDLRRDREGRFQLLDLNTVPGLTERSLVPRAAREMGLDFGPLVLEILRTAGEATG